MAQISVKCKECDWKGGFSEVIKYDDGYFCPKCKNVRVEVIPDEPETVYDVKDAVRLWPDEDRFQNYYLFKKVIRTETLPLGYNDLTYKFPICEFEIRFVMPSKIEFSGGIISYNSAERELGIFRFPRNPDGSFCTPVDIRSKLKELNQLTQEDLDRLLKLAPPLEFDAYKIPRYKFEYFDITPLDIKEIGLITSKEFVEELKIKHQKIIEEVISSVKEKIRNSPNYLLILENTLNRRWTDFEEVATATENIIHIG